MATVSHVGAYEIQHQIGSGGMAPVFLATDTRTGRQVALKLLFIDNDHEGQQILEMERGGATLQEQFGRSCRYVPAVYEHGVEGPYFFIAMEHLAGRNLSEVIAAGPLPAGARVEDRDPAVRVPGGGRQLHRHARRAHRAFASCTAI